MALSLQGLQNVQPQYSSYTSSMPPDSMYPNGISETQSKHIHVDLALIDWKDITIIKNGQKVTVTPEELAIKLGLEW